MKEPATVPNCAAWSKPMPHHALPHTEGAQLQAAAAGRPNDEPSSQMHSRSTIEQLEPRVLLSADPISAALGDAVSWLPGMDPADEAERESDALRELTNAAFTSQVPEQIKASAAAPNQAPFTLDALASALAGATAGAITEQASPTESAPEPQVANPGASQPFDLDALAASAATTSTSDVRELVFIDTRTPNYQQLLDDLQQRSQTGALDIVLLDSARDGIEQISNALAGYDDLNAVHIISHGDDGTVQLGDTLLERDNLSQYSEAISGWADALSEQADLLFYGCELAASADGKALVQGLATLSGADVAASTDLTGHSALDGDWDLEFTAGAVEHTSTFSTSLQQQWAAVLATVTVNTFNDLSDGGITTSIATLKLLPGSDGISLREAVIATNNTAGADAIVLAAGTYNSASGGWSEDFAVNGDLDIRDTLTITGAGASLSIIHGPSNDRVFQVHAGVTLTITDVTITGGRDTFGAGLAMLSGSDVTLERVIVFDNRAMGGGTGGGIHNDGGTLALGDVTLADNTANSGSAFGGGLYNNGVTILEQVTINGNSAKFGGGIYNTATGLTLNNVTISGNQAETDGGGIWTDEALTATHVTLALNAADSNLDLSGDGAGIWAANGADVTLHNSIFSANTTYGAADNVFSLGAAALTSLGGNVDDDGTAGLSQPSDTSGPAGVDLQLGALANNGGFTQTHTILIGSTAINHGVGTPLATDQRGTARDASVDAGAYENVSSLTAADDNDTTNEDIALNSDVSGNDATTSGGTLSYAKASDPANGAVTVNANGTFIYTPALNVNGSDSFTYTVTDATSGEALTQTVSITVNAVLDLTATADVDTTNEDAALNGNVSGNDSTTSGGTLSYAKTTDPANGAVTVNANGTYTYTPDSNFNGADSFTYTVTDADSGEALTRTVNITINAVADLSALDDVIATADNVAVSGDVSINDSTTSGGTLAFAINNDATDGSVSGDGNGAFTYNPNALFTGTDTFTYTVTDANAAEGATRTVTVSVAPVNNAPTALITPVGYAVNENTILALQGTGLSVADSDAGDAAIVATLSVGEGALSVDAGGTGVTLAGTPSAVTLTGTLAQINNLLAGASAATIGYQAINAPTAVTTLTLAVNDLGNSGFGGALVGADIATLTIAAENDAPHADAGNANRVVFAPAPLVLHGTGLTVSDPDAGSAPILAVLNVGEGTLAISAGSTGVIVSGNGSSSASLTGTVTQINALLAGKAGASVDYQALAAPTTNTTLTLTVNDTGNTGTGGPLVASDSSTLNITLAPAVVPDPDPDPSPAPPPVADPDPAPVPELGPEAESEPAAEPLAGPADADAKIEATPIVTSSGLVLDSVDAPTSVVAIPPADSKNPGHSFSDALTRQGLDLLRQIIAQGTDPLLELTDSRVRDIPLAEAQASLLHAFDRVRDELIESGDEEQVLMASAVSASTGLSVGYVAWLLRGGVLLSSLMSSLPAWRMLDPLPVLGRMDDDEDDDDLSDMVERDAAKDGAAVESAAPVTRGRDGVTAATTTNPEVDEQTR
ncbi:MAG: hypothetical protein ACI9DC_000320 [Gammaproteobacteria bacterium]|jgi:hypothetical protein